MAETRKTPIASHPALLRLATSFAGAFDPKKGILQILCVFLAFGPSVSRYWHSTLPSQ